jgi:hypothetical protein
VPAQQVQLEVLQISSGVMGLAGPEFLLHPVP